MMFGCVLGQVEVFLMILGVFVTSVVTPICVTWKTTTVYLTVKCIVPDAKHEILFVDPFGKNRGQCSLENRPTCSKNYKDDLIFMEKFQRLTTVTLKTIKHNAIGEWKCRYGKKETISQVSYIEGFAPNINIEISGEIEKHKKGNRFILSCFSCWKPHVEGVDFYVNDVLEDTIRNHEDLCYHKLNQCRPERCSCSANGKNFTWSFMSDLSYIKFTCTMRFENERFIRQADLVYNGSLFIHMQTTNMSISNSNNNSHNITVETDNDQQKETGNLGYVIFGIIGTLILVISLICVLRIRAKRRKNKMSKKRGDVEEQNDEVSQLLQEDVEEQNSQDVEPLLGDVEEQNSQDVEPLSDIGKNQSHHDESSPGIETFNHEYSKELAYSSIDSQKQKESVSLVDNCLTKGSSSVFGGIIQTKDVQVACICSNSQKELEYISKLMTILQKLGFQPNNITLISVAFPDNFFSQTLKTVMKLVIVIPEEYQVCKKTFIKLVETAGRHLKGSPLADIIPVVRSKKASVPLWLTEMKMFRRLESPFENALLRYPPAKKLDGPLNALNANQNTLNKIQFDKETCKRWRNLALEVLKGWGVEVEQKLLSVRLGILQSVSRYDPICLNDFVDSFVRDTSTSFIRFYDCEQLDLGNFKLHTHMHKQIMKIFRIFFGRRSNYCWYHYRRNGLRRSRSSIENYLKSIFLNENPSMIFQQFSTYESRLRSFNNYPNENKLFWGKLAFAGFFYLNFSDYVQCFYCKGCLRTWNITDDPLKRHRENFETCPFVIQIDRKLSSEEKRKPSTNYKVDGLQDRIISFRSFPDKISNSDVQRLAVDGFYYCGIATDIVCLACNIGFADPRKCNEILRLHKIYSKDCPNISTCDNHTQSINMLDHEDISNFHRYLEIEVRRHDIKR